MNSRKALFSLLITYLIGIAGLMAQNDTISITGKFEVPNCPAWVNSSVFYQIFPQTYYDTDGDGIGDLNGIIQKLDYIKSLNVDVIWLNPFFESPFRNAGYDISDYYKVAPRYGTNDDAKRLFEEAHKRGLKVIFDYVIGYTSIDHPWFKESAKQEPNKYSNWYIWTDNTWVNPPDSFKNTFIKGYSRRNGQYMSNSYWSQPVLNFGFAKPEVPWMLPTNHPDVMAMREELKKILRFWMDMGADGFRSDMAGALVKNANIKENDQLFNAKDEGTKQFWQEIRQMMDMDYPGSLMVSDWSDLKDALDNSFHADFLQWPGGCNNLIMKESWRALNGLSEGHSFFDKEGNGNIRSFLDSYLEQYYATKAKGYISIPIGNHDNARFNIQRTNKELEMIYAFGLTMPGVPFVYYGNEIGMRQLYGLPNVEGAYPPLSGSRTPMQWSPGKNLGFSNGDSLSLYLPVDTAVNAPTVAVQEKNSKSLLNNFRKLTTIKRREAALAAYAEFVPVYAKENSYPFIYARANGEEIILCVFNPADSKEKAEFKLNIKAKKIKLLAGDHLSIISKGNKYTVESPPVSYAVYKIFR